MSHKNSHNREARRLEEIKELRAERTVMYKALKRIAAGADKPGWMNAEVAQNTLNQIGGEEEVL